MIALEHPEMSIEEMADQCLFDLEVGNDEHYLITEEDERIVRIWMQQAYLKGKADAAAPELLEALKGVVRIADRKTVEFDAAHAAIAKAEGKEVNGEG